MNAIARLSVGICALIGVGTAGVTQAEPRMYSNYADFAAALPAKPAILNFDALNAGATIADAGTAEGITFRYDFQGLRMKVAHIYATTSAPNFLGTNDGGVFHDGDDFSLSFLPSSAIGLYFISADPLISGDLTVSAAGVTAALDAEDVQETLPDGSRVYFLGIIDDQQPFDIANVVALAGGFFLYNVDDIITAPINLTASSAMPEPAVSNEPKLLAERIDSETSDR
jgi:hypothetical protein